MTRPFPCLLMANRDFVAAEQGQDLVEYGLLAAFVSIVLLLLLIGFNDPLRDLYQAVLTRLTEMAAIVGG